MSSHPRYHAMRQLTRGVQAVAEWAAVIRLGAERGVGSAETASVVEDAAYCQAMDLYGRIKDAADTFAALAERIERGGR